MTVAGLIAAAGRSLRMGKPKALLRIDETTFAQHLVEVFRSAGLAPVIVTLPEPPDLDVVMAGLAPFVASASDVTWVRNAWPDLGLGGSIRTGLTLVGDVEGLVLCPVDCPFGDADLVRELAREVAAGAPAVVPVVGTRWGHPVAFGRSSFRALDRAAEARGARTVLEALGDSLIEVPADDARLVEDIDTPERYRQFFPARP